MKRENPIIKRLLKRIDEQNCRVISKQNKSDKNGNWMNMKNKRLTLFIIFFFLKILIYRQRKLTAKIMIEWKHLAYKRISPTKWKAQNVEKRIRTRDLQVIVKQINLMFLLDYEAMTLRQYQRLSTGIKPDMKTYGEMRQVMLVCFSFIW